MRTVGGPDRGQTHTVRATSRVLTAAVVVALIGGAAGCGAPAGAGARPYALIPAAQREDAITFVGVSGRGGIATTTQWRGRVLLLGFDVPNSPAMKPQLALLRRTYTELRGSGVRSLQVTITSSELTPIRVAVQGRIITYPTPPAGALVRQTHRLATAGLAMTQLLDRRGRVAAQLIGTSDAERLELTVKELLAESS